MTSRERWTVYPLLLLAIGLGMLDKIAPSSVTEFDTVRCRRLAVISHDRSKLITLGGTADDAGLVTLYRQVPISQAGPDIVLVGGRKTQSAIELSADSAGGSMELFGQEDSLNLVLGHNAQERISGLMSRDEQGLRQINGRTWGVHFPWAAADLPGDEGPTTEESQIEEAAK